MKNFVRCWLPVAVWCSLIFYLSSLPNLKTEFGFWDLILRKIAHVTEYAILCILAYRAFRYGAGGAAAARAFLFAALFSVAYAASDEYHQSFVPGRGPSVADVGIDALGVAAGIVILRSRDRRQGETL